MANRHLIPLLFLFLANQSLAQQQTPEEYGLNIYTLVVNNKTSLVNEFVELGEYNAYIDRLAELPDKVREDIKYDATRTYNDVQKEFEKECSRILKLYKRGQIKGIKFSYLYSTFEPSKNFPDIGFITCVYSSVLPEDEDEYDLGEEEDTRDAFRFEAIKTANGWRILDGFFDAILEP